HAVFAPLPELHRLGPHQITAPALGPRRARIAQLASKLLEAALELLALDRRALRRDRRGDPAVPGPAGEVGIGFLRGEPLHPTPGADLPVQLAPVDDKRRSGIGGQLGALGARVVAEEAKAVGPR